MALKHRRALTRGRSIGPLCILILAFAYAPSSAAAENTWAGVWDSDFGRLTMDAGGSGSYTGFNPGTISGHVTGDVNEGTWHQPGDPPKGGKFKFTLGAGGQSFAGVWAYDAGGCGSACGWSGTCIEGPCLKNGTSVGCVSASRAAFAAGTCPPPVPTPRSVRPKLGETTSYKAPRPGKVASLPLPTLGAKARSAAVTIGYIAASGGAEPVPPVVGVVTPVTGTEDDDRYASAALKICSIYFLGALPDAYGSFINCAFAVITVLKRNDEIQAKRRREAGAGAAAKRCRSAKIARRGKRTRVAVKIRCTATATGLRLTFRRLPGRPSLRKLFGRKGALVVGRSRFDLPAAAGDRVNVTWRASGG